MSSAAELGRVSYACRMIKATLRALVFLFLVGCLGPTPCETYCQRAADCLGMLSEVPACVDRCETELSSYERDYVVPPCADCFERNSCPSIAGGACVSSCP